MNASKQLHRILYVTVSVTLVAVALAGSIRPANAGISRTDPTPARDTAMDRNLPDPRGLREEQNMRYQGALDRLREAQIDAQAQRDIGYRNCREDRGCLRQLAEQYQTRIREIGNRRTEENALYRKAMIEIGQMERERKTYAQMRDRRAHV